MLPDGIDHLAPYWDRVRTWADPDVGGVGRFLRRPMPAELQNPPRMADCHPERVHRAHGLCASCCASAYKAAA